MSIYLLILLEAMLPCAALYTAPHDAQITKNTFLLQILLRSVNAGCRNAAFPFTLINHAHEAQLHTNISCLDLKKQLKSQLFSGIFH